MYTDWMDEEITVTIIPSEVDRVFGGARTTYEKSTRGKELEAMCRYKREVKEYVARKPWIKARADAVARGETLPVWCV